MKCERPVCSTKRFHCPGFVSPVVRRFVVAGLAAPAFAVVVFVVIVVTGMTVKCSTVNWKSIDLILQNALK